MRNIFYARLIIASPLSSNRRENVNFLCPLRSPKEPLVHLTRNDSMTFVRVKIGQIRLFIATSPFFPSPWFFISELQIYVNENWSEKVLIKTALKL